MGISPQTLAMANKYTDDKNKNIDSQLEEKANKNDYKYIPRNEEELTQFLLEGKSVYINKDFGLTHTIHINKNNIEIEFDKSVIIDMSNKTFPCITVGTTEFKPIYVRIKYPKIIGNGAIGSIGILVNNMGFNSEIFSPTIQGMERAIKTSDFDCMQLNSIYEPLLTGNKIGLDDSNGGIQACRIFGGRIEQNSEYGVILASPNVHFLGTVIEGNTKAEVKLLNEYSDIYKMTHPSGARFVSCYFEHVADRVGTEGTIFKLGDESQNNGWFGHLDLIACDFYISGDKNTRIGKPILKSLGNALASGESQKTINILGGTFGVNQIFDLQNVGTDTSIIASGVNILPSDSVPITTKVNLNAKLSCGDKTGSQQYDNVRTRYVCGGKVSDVSVIPCENIYSKEIRLEPSQSEKGNFIKVTTSNMKPWEDSAVGVISGSLHFCSLYKKWYQRVIGKSGTDLQANWVALKIDDDRQSTNVPAFTPERLFQHCYDYVNKKMYVSFGTSSASDWVAMN